MIDFSTPLLGMARAAQIVEGVSQRLANAGAATQPGDTVNLSAEAIALLEARQLYKANVNAARAADDLSRDALTLLE